MQEELKIGDLVMARGIILPGFEKHGYVAIGPIVEIKPHGLLKTQYVVEGQDGQQLSYERYELKKISALEGMAFSGITCPTQLPYDLRW